MLIPASGTGQYIANTAKVIRFARKGCTNRPFFHIVVTEVKRDQQDPVIEQVGTYDPIPNEYNEKLCALNFERIKYWLGNGASVSRHVQELFGLSGFYPIHPRTYIAAWRSRRNHQEVEPVEQNELKEESIN
ncbi:probable 28S ribosomal protein S16, mitochondrial [Coccinella septempunctata]|uniref:probable 28S ribosomal protein S16, mitochondrial n=1 Tax=Coccinella septempunctata TaxID=41139 RepID=UPI001D071526|nr:probable 28S ribosomal protein S16, mitochondrial [Coccinella septempunctata]